MSTYKRAFIPTYIDGSIIEYHPLVLALKVYQPHQSSPRPSGRSFHYNNAARSARAKESDQVNTPTTGEGTKNTHPISKILNNSKSAAQSTPVFDIPSLASI